MQKYYTEINNSYKKNKIILTSITIFIIFDHIQGKKDIGPQMREL
jgi:hypothetical protein